MTHQWYRFDIQGLRAIAILAVIAFHYSNYLPNGFMGVDIFFVISGFVIAGLVKRKFSEGKSGFEFLLDRAWRLTPSLIAVIFFTCVIAPFILSPFGAQYETGGQALSGLFSFTNFALWLQGSLYFSLDSSIFPLKHLWSLSLEDQLYIVIAIGVQFFFLSAKRSGVDDRSRLYIVFVLFSVFAGIFFVALFPPSILNPPMFIGSFYSPLLRWWEFAVGLLLAFYLDRLKDRAPFIVSQMMSALGLFGLLFCFLYPFNVAVWPSALTAVPVFLTAFIIFSGPDAWGNRLLSARLLRYIGDHSYALYLWHWPLLVYVRLLWPRSHYSIAIALALTCLFSLLSKKYIEDAVKEKRKYGANHSLVGLLRLMSRAAIAGVVLMLGSLNGWGQAPTILVKQQIDRRPIGRDEKCVNQANPDMSAAGGCMWNKSGNEKPLYVIGDSMAGQWTNIFIDIGAQEKKPVVLNLYESCPFIEFGAENHPSFVNEKCKPYVKNTLSRLASAPLGIVIIGMSPNYLNPSNQHFFTQEFTKTIRQLVEMGHKVVVLGATPQFYPWGPEKCLALNAYTNPAKCGAMLLLTDVEREQSSFQAMLHDVSVNTGATIIELRQWICTDKVCSTNEANQWIMRDTYHLTIAYTEKLAPRLKQSLDAIR